MTPCCRSPICERCLFANPRLARYDPCLACLDGVGLVAASARKEIKNIDAAVRDEDTYVIGEDEEDEGQDEGTAKAPPPPYEFSPTLDTPLEPPQDSSSSVPLNYYIKRNDTLRGIALRFGINACPYTPFSPSPILHFYRNENCADSTIYLQAL